MSIIFSFKFVLNRKNFCIFKIYHIFIYVSQNYPEESTGLKKGFGKCEQEFENVDSKLQSKTMEDDIPTTSKAAAARTTCKNSYKKKSHKVIQYNTNHDDFWTVLLNIDLNTKKRFANIKEFPIISTPKWEWNQESKDFISFNDSPFSKLLEMLPFKVISRSPHLTDMLVKLLASLSSSLPREDNISEDCFGAKKKDFSSTANSKSDDIIEESNKTLKSTNNPKMYSKNFSQLQLVVEVLTHQCCTAEGLENVSKLIVNLSQCSKDSNAIISQYLNSAILGLSEEVRQLIQELLNEIKQYNDTYVQQQEESSTSQSSSEQKFLKGVMQDRFTSKSVVISASTKPCYELQLPAMKKLLSSVSPQPFFLRTLKIFMEVRQIMLDKSEHSTNHSPLSQIICLDNLWQTLSECLISLEQSKDEYAVLVLQPTVEAFFLIHASNKKTSSANSNLQSNEKDTSTDNGKHI